MDADELKPAAAVSGLGVAPLRNVDAVVSGAAPGTTSRRLIGIPEPQTDGAQGSTPGYWIAIVTISLAAQEP